MIKTIIRFENNMVMVFNQGGEQIPKYQGQYQNVKESILHNAPIDAVFAHSFTDIGELRKVTKEEW